MWQRLFISANVQAELNERSSVIDDHEFASLSKDNRSEHRYSGSKVIIIALALYFIWIWVGIIFYKFYDNWTLGNRTVDTDILQC